MHNSDRSPSVTRHLKLWLIGIVVISLHALAFQAIQHVPAGWVTGRVAAAHPMGTLTMRVKLGSSPGVIEANSSATRDIAPLVPNAGPAPAAFAATGVAAAAVAPSATVATAAKTAYMTAAVVGSSEIPAPQQLPVPNPAEAPPRFYGFDEVAMPAEPVSEMDWNLDVALLDGAGVARLVFKIYVSDTGEVLAVNLLEPQFLDVGIQRLLEYQLRQARLTPAIRAGVAVASTRQVEMFRVGTFSEP